MEVIVKLGKTNAMTNTWGETKTKTIFWAIPLSSLVSKKMSKPHEPRHRAALEV